MAGKYVLASENLLFGNHHLKKKGSRKQTPIVLLGISRVTLLTVLVR